MVTRTFPYTLVGPAQAEDEAWLRGARAELGLEACVEYLGSQEHARVLECMRDAHVCVYPFPRTAELDGVLPIKVLEYLACGRAVVSTALEGVTHVVRHEENGLVVPVRDQRALSEAVIALCADAERRRRLGAAGRRLVEARADYRRCMDELETADRELLANATRRKDS